VSLQRTLSLASFDGLALRSSAHSGEHNGSRNRLVLHNCGITELHTSVNRPPRGSPQPSARTAWSAPRRRELPDTPRRRVHRAAHSRPGTKLNSNRVAYTVPPLGLAEFLVLGIWAIHGFSASKAQPRRAWVIGKGLLLRLHLRDGRIITIPMLQLLDDSSRPELKTAFAEWCIGKNGYLDSLPEHPDVSTYVENWAIDRSHLVFGTAKRLSADLRCVWSHPTCKRLGSCCQLKI
jgi:hypothetical protein